MSFGNVYIAIGDEWQLSAPDLESDGYVRWVALSSNTVHLPSSDTRTDVVLPDGRKVEIYPDGTIFLIDTNDRALTAIRPIWPSSTCIGRYPEGK